MTPRYLAVFICTLLLFSIATAQKKDQYPNYQKHYVRDRETASSIAKDFGIKLKDFLLVNDFPDDVKLKPGQLVLIRQLKDGEKANDEKPYVAPKPQQEETAYKPGDDDETRGGAEEPVKVKKETHVRKEVKKEPVDETKSESSGETLIGPNGVKYELSTNGIHVVQKGQTFFHLAKIYHLSLDELKSLNNMSDTNIRIGQALKVRK